MNGTVHTLPRRGPRRRVLITGGAGFIGTNLADRLAGQGSTVFVLDDLSRSGVEGNLQWLTAKHPRHVRAEVGKVTDAKLLAKMAGEVDTIYHLAAQVAVTSSLTDVLHDFEVNARGTVQLLEMVKAQDAPPLVVFTSTNKVYGDLSSHEMVLRGDRYEPADEMLSRHGVDESTPLDFHSPYGCSKGAADQYVLDAARSFRLPTTVFRMSCIYGPHQHGTEDQGWLAHFLIRAMEKRPITLFGDGRQVRDVLYVEDLVDAFLAVREHVSQASGQVFNVGGGPASSTSLLELIERIEELEGSRPEIRLEGWRTGDQRWFVADTRHLSRTLGWRRRWDLGDGVAALHRWLAEHRRPTEAAPAEPVPAAQGAAS